MDAFSQRGKVGMGVVISARAAAHVHSFPRWGKVGMGANGTETNTGFGEDAPLAPTPTLPQRGREKQPRNASSGDQEMLFI
jgi:hypothetical protein